MNNSNREQKNILIFFFWLEVLIFAAMIFTLSSKSYPLPALTKIKIRNFDKVLHVIEYSAFGYLLLKAFSTTFDFRSSAKLVIVVLAVGFIYALTDEYHQACIPCRESSVLDAAADLCGLTAASLIWFRLPVLRTFSVIRSVVRGFAIVTGI